MRRGERGEGVELSLAWLYCRLRPLLKDAKVDKASVVEILEDAPIPLRREPSAALWRRPQGNRQRQLSVAVLVPNRENSCDVSSVLELHTSA